MTAINAINSAISKGRDLAATAGVVGQALDAFGIPNPISGALNTLFGNGTGLGAGDNRRDLNNFISTVSKLNGFSRPNHFYVEIAPPIVMRDKTDDLRTLPFLCESANLPGVALATSEIRRYGYGPTEKKPYAPIFVDTSMTFLVDGSGLIQNFFYKWMNSIVKFDSMPWGNGVQAGGKTLFPFEVNYKEQYATDIIITTVDDANNDIVTVRLTEAYPIFMGDVSLSWADTDSISRLPITFAYFNWKIENINYSQLQKERSPGLIQNLLKVGTAIQVLADIKKPNNVADVINVVNNSKIALGAFR
jgi:hypothetical protein